jgi:hypothetical protein
VSTYRYKINVIENESILSSIKSHIKPIIVSFDQDEKDIIIESVSDFLSDKHENDEKYKIIMSIIRE